MKIVFTNKQLTVKNLNEKLQEEVVKATNQMAAAIVEESRKNAPETPGDILEKSIKFIPATGNNLEAKVIANNPLATVFHEAEYKEPEVVVKPTATESGGVGNKFIERSVTSKSKDLLDFLVDFIKGFLEGKSEKRKKIVENVEQFMTKIE